MLHAENAIPNYAMECNIKKNQLANIDKEHMQIYANNKNKIQK